MNLYCLKPDDFKNKNIHNICREIFSSHENITRSLELHDSVTGETSFLVLSHLEAPYRKISINPKKLGEKVGIFSSVCFEYRRKEKKGCFLTEDEALESFLKKTGLKKSNSDIEIEKTRKVTSFSKNKTVHDISNTFFIRGEFEIENPEIFNTAIQFGIGTRGSYGFGIILTEEQLNEVLD